MGFICLCEIVMDLLTLVVAVEHHDDTYPADEILAGIREHRKTLQRLSGFWERLVKALDDLGEL